MRPLRKAVLVIAATVVVATLFQISPTTAVAINPKKLAESNSITFDNTRSQYEELSSGESLETSVLHSQSGHRRTKRTLMKIKPIVQVALYPAKLVLQAGSSIVSAKAHKAKEAAVGVGLRVAKVAVKTATSLGIKALLLNFLFHKINQVIDFKTRLLGNLDQNNKKQNAQFLANGQAAASTGKGTDGDSGVIDQQVQAQGDGEDEPVSFSPNKVSLQLPDRLFGPSFTAANGISQAIGTVIQNTAARLARFIEALKPLLWKSSRLASSSSGSNPPDNDEAASSDAVVRDSSDLDFVEMNSTVPVAKITPRPITTTNKPVESSTRVPYVQVNDQKST
ncbi:uncharacterized protein LOC126899221 [Daktulosphaira vitifoliae]|uniref:uncharacterized protein LOC126899221 n=1 Tax=Daktulosphaira vitifoliae TaxID=58002 RepID=UPI0021A9BFF5|nr:uncharacterized protein LOC126899221 [Daktulosphaira vitifoliae]